MVVLWLYNSAVMIRSYSERRRLVSARLTLASGVYDVCEGAVMMRGRYSTVTLVRQTVSARWHLLLGTMYDVSGGTVMVEWSYTLVHSRGLRPICSCWKSYDVMVQFLARLYIGVF